MAYVECAKFGFGVGEGEYWVLIPENLEENYVIPWIRSDSMSVFLRSMPWQGVTINVLISNNQGVIDEALRSLRFAKKDLRKKFKQQCLQLIGKDRAILAKFILDIVDEPIVKSRFGQGRK